MSGLGGSEAGGLGDAGYGPSGPSDVGGSGGGGGVDSVDAGYFADVGNFDPAGVAGLSDVPGQTVQGALGQMLFDLALQQDTTSAAGMKDAISTLGSLANLGFGKVEGLNPNNPTQSVDEMLAAQNVSNILGYVAPAIASMVPGYGTISTIGRVGAGLLSGTMTPGQAFSLGLSGLLGAKTGVPSGIFEGIFEGNLGKAASSGAQAGLASLATGLTGSPLAGALTGAAFGPAVGRATSEAVGGSRSGGISSLPGASAPSTSTTPTGNTYSDSGITQDISPVRAAIEQATQQAVTPAWDRQIVAGRYGPTVQYEYGA